MEKIIGKSPGEFSRKLHLNIAKFQILPILWLTKIFSDFQL